MYKLVIKWIRITDSRRPAARLYKYNRPQERRPSASPRAPSAVSYKCDPRWSRSSSATSADEQERKSAHRFPFESNNRPGLGGTSSSRGGEIFPPHEVGRVAPLGPEGFMSSSELKLMTPSVGLRGRHLPNFVWGGNFRPS